MLLDSTAQATMLLDENTTESDIYRVNMSLFLRGSKTFITESAYNIETLFVQGTWKHICAGIPM